MTGHPRTAGHLRRQITSWSRGAALVVAVAAVTATSQAHAAEPDTGSAQARPETVSRQVPSPAATSGAYDPALAAVLAGCRIDWALIAALADATAPEPTPVPAAGHGTPATPPAPSPAPEARPAGTPPVAPPPIAKPPVAPPPIEPPPAGPPPLPAQPPTAPPATTASVPAEQPDPTEQGAGTAPSPASPAGPPAPRVGTGPGTTLSDGDWLSGAAGPGVVDGTFGSWRGSDVEIAGSWSDNNEAMVEMWQLRPGAEFATWQRPMDIAIGAIGPGETWSAAAQGAYDARWRQSLTTMRDLWGDRPATLYIRFAHESNGNWYPWSVDAGEVGAFRAAWVRFRALQQEVFPESELVFSVNRESVGSGFDWRQSFPGSQYVDVMSVDYYNQWPSVVSDAEWAAALDDTDQYGAPKGLRAHLDFAHSVGLPLAISEWSGNAGQSDSPAFMRNMHAFLAEHGGSGAGQILYEILFDVPGYDGNFLLTGATRQPAAAAAYRDVF